MCAFSTVTRLSGRVSTETQEILTLKPLLLLSENDRQVTCCHSWVHTLRASVYKNQQLIISNSAVGGGLEGHFTDLINSVIKISISRVIFLVYWIQCIKRRSRPSLCWPKSTLLLQKYGGGGQPLDRGGVSPGDGSKVHWEYTAKWSCLERDPGAILGFGFTCCQSLVLFWRTISYPQSGVGRSSYANLELEGASRSGSLITFNPW